MSFPRKRESKSMERIMDNKKSIDNLNLQNRIDELNNIYKLHEIFGNNAFRTIEKFYNNSGFIKGIDLLTKMINQDEFSKDEFQQNPVFSIEKFLKRYFKERGGNQPEIWSEKNIVYLKTEFCKYCVTIEAEKSAKKCHDDVCAIYCRTFTKGIVSVLEDFFPEIVINFYNVSSRREGEEQDCIEAFQIISSRK